MKNPMEACCILSDHHQPHRVPSRLEADMATEGLCSFVLGKWLVLYEPQLPYPGDERVGPDEP